MDFLKAIIKEVSRLTNKDDLTAAEAHQLLTEANDVRSLVEKALAEHIEQLSAAYESLFERVSQTEAQLSSINALVEDRLSKSDELNAQKIDNLKSTLAEVAKSVATLSAKVGSSAADINDTSEPIADVTRAGHQGVNVIKMPGLNSFSRQTKN